MPLDRIRSTYYLSRRTITILEALPESTKSKSMTNAVDYYGYFKYIVYRLYNNANKRSYIGLIKSPDHYDDNFLTKALNSNKSMALDVKQYGQAEFDYRRIGSFNRIDEALEFRDYIMNRLIDEGAVLYNSDVYVGSSPRILSIQLDIKLASNFLKYCKIKKYTVNGLVKNLIKKAMKSN